MIGHLTFTKVLHDLFDNASLQYVGNIHSFGELSHKCRLAHAFRTTDNNDEGDSLLVELRHQLVSLHKSFTIIELGQLQEEYMLEFGLGHFRLVSLHEMLFDIQSDFDCIFFVNFD